MLKYYAIKTSFKTNSSHSFANICYRDWIPVFVNMIVADNPPLSSNKFITTTIKRNAIEQKKKKFARPLQDRNLTDFIVCITHDYFIQDGCPIWDCPVNSFQKVLSQAFERTLNTPLLKLKNNITLKLLLSFVDILEFWMFWHIKKKNRSPEKKLKFARVPKGEISSTADLLWWSTKVNLKILVWLCKIEVQTWNMWSGEIVFWTATLKVYRQNIEVLKQIKCKFAKTSQIRLTGSLSEILV